MLDNGGNLAPPASTLAYSIEDRDEGPRVEWLEDPLPITAEEALAADQAACQAVVAAPEHREAEGWLSEVLSAGPVPAQEVEFAARQVGISPRTLRRAKDGIRVVSEPRASAARPPGPGGSPEGGHRRPDSP